VAYQVERDKGISGILGISCPTLIKKMLSFSEAGVYLVEVDGVQFIRKYISKSNVLHFEILKKQVDDIKRFNFYWPGSCPKILNIFENNDEFYYDIEYLSSHSLLASFSKDEQLRVLNTIFSRFFKDVYCYKKKINGSEWVTNYINEKINPRLNEIEAYDEVFHILINSSSLTINNKSIMGLRSLLEGVDIFIYAPSEIQPIHGDLTLQNILYCKSTNDIKLIDLGGTKYMDSYYLDIGKVFQSLIARYEEWNIFELFQILDKEL
jgi:serine/threonine protein kinase